jgi:hypothetical protein
MHVPTAIETYREPLILRFQEVLRMIKGGMVVRGELTFGVSPSELMFEIAGEYLVGEHGRQEALQVIRNLTNAIERGGSNGAAAQPR